MPTLLDLLSETWPAKMGKMAWSAVTLPGQVYAGEVTPNDPAYYARATDLAGLLVLGGALPGAIRKESLASKSARLYNPPTKPPRPFTSDYPHGTSADATGRLTGDIEGRPLFAERIVGRRTLGGPDEALSPAGVYAVGEGSVGARYSAVPARTLRGDAGRLVISPGRDRASYDILLNQRLSPIQLDRVAAHETSHLIDEIVGRIPTTGLTTELRQVYNTLNTGQEKTRNLMGPGYVGYKCDAASRELIVEAIRAYMADPNYMKTMAPNTAAAIRESINAHPTLSKIIQFNTIAGLASGAITPAALPIPMQPAPVLSQ
jgi:hypothetical protein